MKRPLRIFVLAAMVAFVGWCTFRDPGPTGSPRGVAMRPFAVENTPHPSRAAPPTRPETGNQAR
jgi:hypothetical protein